ncbi:hypothetical protein DXG01_002368 [Tephrocybe rancida]|nr:hypothetical protein DXG01_002368 [Tephrocybe rancida]
MMHLPLPYHVAIERLTFGISVFHAFRHQWWKAAEDVLQECGKPEADLQAEWKVQVKAQTKPLPRQSRNAGKDAVEELIQLRETRDGLKKRQRDYDTLIEAENTPADKYKRQKQN